MKVIWTSAALADLDDILAYTSANYPLLVNAVELRIRAVVLRIGQWPSSARLVEERHGVRVVPLVRYPYRVFYQVQGSAIEILHIHHAARTEPP
jgi:plasmid stabilization system protein ParE